MARADPPRAPFTIGDIEVAPGERCTVDIPVSVLSNHTGVNLSVQVIHGKKDGPVVFVSGAVHGDEIIGVEIIRRLTQMKACQKVFGTLLLVPIVNAFGFLGLSRYLPDRRDLNRSFPGSSRGSLASQLAHLFMTEIAERCQYGIDLHSGAVHRANLPQIRANLEDENIAALACAFGAPIALNANLRDGSLRQAAQEAGCAMLLYEAGEALRFDENAIRIGVRGVLNVLRKLDVIKGTASRKGANRAIISKSSHWLRAPMGGIMRAYAPLGERVKKDEPVAVISDPFGEVEEDVVAREDGVIIGRTNLPIVNRGDALFHVAEVYDPEEAGASIMAIEQEIEDDPLFDGAGIV